MSTLFRLDASIRGDGSVSRSLADRLQSELSSSVTSLTVVERDIGLSPLPATAWAGAVFGRYVPEADRSPEQMDGIALSKKLADELAGADAFIFALPLYNFGVSQHFKAWIDLILTDPRFAPGTESAIKGRHAQLIVSRGGGYGEGTPRHGWDHATSFYLRVLRDMLLLDVELIECELTLADVTPAMESLRGLAAQNLQQAMESAGQRGRQLAGVLADRAAA
jgi:FMN-dependent NADH-azoreductase